MQCRIIGQVHWDKQHYLPDWRAGVRELTHAATRARVRATCVLHTAEGNHPGDLFVNATALKNLRRLTHIKVPLL
jgi:hypothetical protein